MSTNKSRKQRAKLQAQLEELDREIGDQVEVIDAEVVELPEYATGSESRHPSEDSTNRSPAENDTQYSTTGPMNNPSGGQQAAEAPAVSLPAVLSRQELPRWSEQWWEQAPPEVQARRCKAHKKTGQRCLKAALMGTTVCRVHGGAAGHVVAAARARLANAADAMASNLVGLAKGAESEAVRVRATEGVLDRVGIGRTTEVTVGPAQPKPYEEIFEDIQGGSRAANRARRGIYDQAYSDTYGYGHDEGGTASTESASAESHSYIDGYGGPGVDGEPSFEPSQRNSRYPGRPSSDGHSSDTHPAEQRRYVDQDGEVYTADEAAIRAARLANEACGALPEQRAITSNHKRYRRPW